MCGDAGAENQCKAGSHCSKLGPAGLSFGICFAFRVSDKLVINMLPSLILGVVPLIAYMIVPRTYAFASAVLCVFSLVHVGTGYVDYLNIVHLLSLPADSKIQISGAKIYWM